VKRIYYLNGSVLTGDFVADAITDLARVIASGKSSTAVDIPVLLPNGETSSAKFLISPESPMMSVPETVSALVNDSWDECVAHAATESLRERITVVRLSTRAAPLRVDSSSAYASDFGGV
jgi:hypothetical protein